MILLYYEEQYEKLEDMEFLTTLMEYHLNHSLHLSQIGIVELEDILLQDDFESFHYSIAEGTASGCVPVVWPWKGAEEFYPKSWRQNHKQITEILLDTNRTQEAIIKENKDLISQRYSMEIIFNKLMKEIGVEK